MNAKYDKIGPHVAILLRDEAKKLEHSIVKVLNAEFLASYKLKWQFYDFDWLIKALIYDDVTGIICVDLDHRKSSIPIIFPNSVSKFPNIVYCQPIKKLILAVKQLQPK